MRGPGGRPCPECAVWRGKILVDDVYSGGKPDGKHPLLSEAMAAGFLHPRCKDSVETFFPWEDEPEPNPLEGEELAQAEAAEAEEARQNHAENMAERWDRRAAQGNDSQGRMAARYHANAWKESAAPFEPAKTVEEAQEYAKQFCKKNFMDRTFKGEVNFKGISIEHANAINRALTDTYAQFPELDKLSGIKVVSPTSAQGKKAFKSGSDALFAYSPVEHGIFINKDVLKNPQALDAYMERSREAWDLVMNNIDQLSGSSRDLALRYQKAGRELVSGDTVEGLFTHELGHHVQWTMLDPKTTNEITGRMQTFAPHLSGYATASKSEYLAESFAAYMKGERDLLDPEYVRFLDARLRGEKIVSLTSSPVNVSKPIVFTLTEGHDIIASTAQLGKKLAEHCRDYGLNVGDESARNWMIDHIRAILQSPDMKVPGTFRGQGSFDPVSGIRGRGPVWFYIKGDDVVIVDAADQELVTIMKDGAVQNTSVRRALDDYNRSKGT